MSKKKRRGVSYVMVVILVAFIFTTGSAMLTLVNFDFRTRIMKSEKVKNMYEADSGLNLVKNIIMKESNDAIVIANNTTMNDQIYGRKTGYMYYANGAFISSDAYKIINVYFKNKFISALTNAADKTSIPSEDVTKDSRISADMVNNNNLLYSISNLSYNDFKTLEDFGNDADAFKDYQTNQVAKIQDFKDGIDGINNSNVSLFKNISLKSADRDPEIKITKIEVSNPTPVSNEDPSKNENLNYYIKITVQSTFQNNTTTTTVSNKKTITTTYTINAPEFQQALKAETQKIKVYPYSFLRAITADGNINVGQDGTTTGLTVTGGIWVKGENDLSDTILDIKYNKGLIVNNAKMTMIGTSDTVKADSNGNDLGDIYTNGSVSLVNNATVDSGKLGSIYSRNVYMGPLDNSSTTVSSGNNLNANKVVTNNDMVMNSSNSTYKIGDYYGINDITDDINKSNGVNGVNGSTSKQSDLARQSSSIIVNNTNPNNSTKINNAYINGVAYLDLGNDTTYQLGESIAVNGNYAAYQDILPGYQSSTGKNVTLSNYSGYDLLYGSVADKSQYFDYYYANKKDAANSGGVQITNLYAYGSTVNGATNASKYKLTAENQQKYINPRKTEYAKKVLLMDNIYDPNINSKTTDTANLSSVYDGYNVIRSVCGVKTDKNEYNPVIAFDKYTGTNPLVSTPGILKNENLEYMFNNDTTKITIKPDGVYYGSETKPRIAKDTSDNTIKAVIITKGDVSIEGSNIHFVGSIISGGDVNIVGDDISITYDESKVKYTIAQASAIYKDALQYVYETTSESYNAVAGTALVTATATVDTDIQRYGSALLTEGLWTLKVKSDENS